MGCEGSKTSRVSSPASIPEIPGPPTGTLLEDDMKKIVKPPCYRWCAGKPPRSEGKNHPASSSTASPSTESRSRAVLSSSSSTVDTLGENSSGRHTSNRGSSNDSLSESPSEAFDAPDSPSQHNMPHVLRFPTRGVSQSGEEDLNNCTSSHVEDTSLSLLLEESAEASDGKAAKANLPMDQYPWLEDTYSKVAPKLETSGVGGGHCETLDSYLLLGVSFCCVANLTQMRLDENGKVEEVSLVGSKSQADDGQRCRNARKRLSWGP